MFPSEWATGRAWHTSALHLCEEATDALPAAFQPQLPACLNGSGSIFVTGNACHVVQNYSTPITVEWEKISIARFASIFGCNLNIQCQVTERSLCSGCRKISQVFCAAQWPTQANKRTGAIHGYMTIPETSQGSTAFFSNHSCLCVSNSTAPCPALHLAAFMPCCRNTQQNTAKDTITVYSTALMAIHRAIHSSNPNRKHKSTNGSHASACVKTFKPFV